nr:hypothetical protein [Candidatus Hydrogenedentota bacterium]
RDARISRIIEGTSEIMRLFIAREAMDTHVRRLMPIMTGKGPKGKLIWEALTFYAKWYPKVLLPTSVSLNVRHLSPKNQDHVIFVARTCKKLARTLFHTMAKYRQKLEREQLVLQALVDIGTDLFAMAALLLRTEHELKARTDDEQLQDMADLFCMNARKRIKDNFKNLRRTQGKAIYKVAKAFMEGKYRWMLEGVYSNFPPASRPARITLPAELAKAEQPELEPQQQEAPPSEK